MEDELELHQAIYQFFLTQIQFGFYSYGETLPSMEELCRHFHVSLDTVNPAYHRLRQESYISLSQKAGARVAVSYGPQDIRRNIGMFYACRKNALADLSSSMWPLFGQIQYFALKRGPSDLLDRIARLGAGDLLTPYDLWSYVEEKYGCLGNELLMRLIRYIYLLDHGYYFGFMGDAGFRENVLARIRDAAALRRGGEWSALPGVLSALHDQFAGALTRLYQDTDLIQPPKETAAFRWDAYKKASQLRYSLAIELLIAISRGVYPVGSYLPPAQRLAAEKGVSVSTIRRALCLLNSIGAVKSSRPLGARVLPPAQSADNCDFTHPVIQRRLCDMAEGLQIFALSARAVFEITLARLDAGALCRWKKRLQTLKSGGHYELVAYASLELLAEHAPCETIRTVYSVFLRLLFWGYPLRGLREKQENVNLHFIPCFDRMTDALEQGDIAVFSSAMERLLLHELRVTREELLQLGIAGADAILIPGPGDLCPLAGGSAE